MMSSSTTNNVQVFIVLKSICIFINDYSSAEESQWLANVESDATLLTCSVQTTQEVHNVWCVETCL